MSRILDTQLQTLGDNYRLTPATLAHRLNPRWMPAKHLMYISQKVATAIAKGNGRVIISLPPRHGKSELITKYTTIWCLEHFPHWNLILASYGSNLSERFSKEVRGIIQTNPHQLNVRIPRESSRIDDWSTPQGGGLKAVGVGGPITGSGADVLLIDDYIKAIKEATSKGYKDDIWDWFRSTAFTRLEPNGSCIIIATRWAEDDLIGRILKSDMAGEWENIMLPAFALPNDPLGRAIDDPLFPERYTTEALNRIKDTMGSYFFNALYQQEPKDDENALTSGSWLKICTEMPPLASMPHARIWDLASTQGGGDWTCGTHMIHDKKANHTFITNVIRRQLSSQGVEALIRRVALNDGINTPIFMEQEPGASGKALVEHYQNTVLPEFKVQAVPHNDGKLTRAQPFIAACEAGRVSLLKGSWNDAFISEFGSFPSDSGKDLHDDQVDTAAIGYVKLSGKKTYAATWGRTSTSTDESNKVQNIDPNYGDLELDPSNYKPKPKRFGVVFGRLGTNN